MPKDNLKDEIVDNELDLSLSNLTTVPVKDLAPLTKATRLDLSCNLLQSLSDDFCTLKHLVKIDLSKNYLESLPDDFGYLVNLQHLDLLGNKLALLPVTFYKLQKLKWLDLKDNPLDEELKSVAGDCLDETQCKKCAIQVVKYMLQMHERMLSFKKKKEEERRKKEEIEKQKEKEEADRKREEKKRRKNEKRKEYEEKNKTEAKKIENIKEPVKEEKTETKESVPSVHPASTKPRSTCLSLFKWILTIFFILLAVVVLFSLFARSCEQDPSCSVCEAIQYKTNIEPYHKLTRTYIQENCPVILKFHDNMIDSIEHAWIHTKTQVTVLIGAFSSDSDEKKQGKDKKFTSTTEDTDAHGRKNMKTDGAKSGDKKRNAP